MASWLHWEGAVFQEFDKLNACLIVFIDCGLKLNPFKSGVNICQLIEFPICDTKLDKVSYFSQQFSILCVTINLVTRLRT